MTIPPNGEYKMFFHKSAEHTHLGGYDIIEDGGVKAHLSLYYDNEEKEFFFVRVFLDDESANGVSNAQVLDIRHWVFRLRGEKLRQFLERNPQLQEKAQAILRHDEK